MKRRFRLWLLVAALCSMCCSTTLAQGGPLPVTVAYLSQHQRDMDGRLVRVRAQVLVGWEGDNFLVDPSAFVVQKGGSTDEPAKLWIFCEPRYEREVCRPAFDASFGKVHAGPVFTFTGYFHFVPNDKGRSKSVFDPGSLQFSANSVSLPEGTKAP